MCRAAETVAWSSSKLLRAQRSQSRRARARARAEEPEPEPRARARAESQKSENFRARDEIVYKPIVFCVNQWSSATKLVKGLFHNPREPS